VILTDRDPLVNSNPQKEAKAGYQPGEKGGPCRGCYTRNAVAKKRGKRGDRRSFCTQNSLVPRWPLGD